MIFPSDTSLYDVINESEQNSICSVSMVGGGGGGQNSVNILKQLKAI